MHGYKGAPGKEDPDHLTDRLIRIDAVARAIGKAIRQCQASCPHRRDLAANAARAASPAGLFAGNLIPYDSAIAMAERQSTSGWDVYQLSEEFGYPVEVVELVLAEVKGRYRREILARSSWRRSGG
jgi:hypothetical protein